MSESAVAIRYAEALYELAEEAGRGPEVLLDLARLRKAVDDDRPGWARLMHPRLSRAEKERVLSERFLAGRDPLVANALRLIVRRRREELLPHFFRAYQDVYDRRQRILRVEVQTASPVDAGVLGTLRQRLEQVTGRTVGIEARLDPALLGGMRLVLDSKVVDGSVRGRLERLRRRLAAVSLG